MRKGARRGMMKKKGTAMVSARKSASKMKVAKAPKKVLVRLPVKKVMKAAELQRVGTSHASFDRYQLTNLTEFAFFCARTATKRFAQFSWLRTFADTCASFCAGFLSSG